jgi:hypothetical protein
MSIMVGSLTIRQSKTILAKTILPFFEIARVLVRFDHIATFIEHQ